MILKIVHYGDKVLREKARPVPGVTPALVKLAEDMVETMYKARGVGLAAEQVGRLESVCVIDVPASCEEDDETRAFNTSVTMPLVMFNPIVISTEGSQCGKEGCLSFPKLGGTVTRPGQVTCQYVDLRGMPQIITVKGFLARAVMHETDHLNGVLYVDHLSAVEKLEMADKLRRMAQKNGGSM
ncbi:MAG: peptide deformylase [Kiritimatiellae bacterium]|nr:peptide deformylase [Kiritimatiellia bacterium]